MITYIKQEHTDDYKIEKQLNDEFGEKNWSFGYYDTITTDSREGYFYTPSAIAYSSVISVWDSVDIATDEKEVKGFLPWSSPTIVKRTIIKRNGLKHFFYDIEGTDIELSVFTTESR